jgi:hypothetical protein
MHPTTYRDRRDRELALWALYAALVVIIAFAW